MLNWGARQGVPVIYLLVNWSKAFSCHWSQQGGTPQFATQEIEVHDSSPLCLVFVKAIYRHPFYIFFYYNNLYFLLNYALGRIKLFWKPKHMIPGGERFSCITYFSLWKPIACSATQRHAQAWEDSSVSNWERSEGEMRNWRRVSLTSPHTQFYWDRWQTISSGIILQKCQELEHFW